MFPFTFGNGWGDCWRRHGSCGQLTRTDTPLNGCSMQPWGDWNVFPEGSFYPSLHLLGVKWTLVRKRFLIVGCRIRPRHGPQVTMNKPNTSSRLPRTSATLEWSRSPKFWNCSSRLPRGADVGLWKADTSRLMGFWLGLGIFFVIALKFGVS